jgi:hypothetical protein
MALKKRRTHQQLFLDALKALANGPEVPVGNGRLKAKLRWDDSRYERVKEELVAAGQIQKGKGYGGSVCLKAGQVGAQALSVFVSYSHADEDLKEALLQHLEPLRVRTEIHESRAKRRVSSMIEAA